MCMVLTYMCALCACAAVMMLGRFGMVLIVFEVVVTVTQCVRLFSTVLMVDVGSSSVFGFGLVKCTMVPVRLVAIVYECMLELWSRCVQMILLLGCSSCTTVVAKRIVSVVKLGLNVILVGSLLSSAV